LFVQFTYSSFSLRNKRTFAFGTLHCCPAAHVGKVEHVSVMVLSDYWLPINDQWLHNHNLTPYLYSNC